MMSASLGPDALSVIGKAFDAAWAEIADTYGNDPVVAARLRLASAMLSIASEDSRDVEVQRLRCNGEMVPKNRTVS